MVLKIKNGFYLSMMRLKVFSIITLFCLPVFGQNKTSFKVEVDDSLNQNEETEVNIYHPIYGLIKKEKIGNSFEINLENYPATIYFYVEGLPLKEVIIENDQTKFVIISLGEAEELNEVVLNAQKRKVFNLNRLNDYLGTSIYAGKKTEVIQVAQIPANIASNNARQIYAQISGLNIYQNDDAGIQLNIGGRGLDPNRTSNFNTRQNGYDISADVLGYPESYYSPPAEAIDEIQIIRGAASLQYGTQFGGLINFVLKEPPNKKIDAVIRNTIGSNNQYTNFTSIGGKKNKFSFPYLFFVLI